MKKNIFFFSLIIVFSISLFFVHFDLVKADELSDLQNKISEYEKQINELQKQSISLSQQISLMDNQIKVAALKISQSQAQIKSLEQEIVALSGKIVRLDGSLNYLSKVLLLRVAETYKKGRFDAFILLVSSKNFSEFVSQYRYLQAVQFHDRQLLLSMEETRTSYDEQKQLKEKLQADLEKLQEKLIAQKQQLAVQVEDRKKLLEETKGREVVYQKLLEATKQELEAIQQIIAGKGEEKEVGKIKEGERVASVVFGSSPCSTGTHLHFEVRDNNDLRNPLEYLRNISLVDKSGGDSHNASGSWNWPLNEPVELNQGYGSNTAAIRSKIVWYNFHTGIDIVAEDRTVKAVKDGTLFRGGVACGRGTLRYVKVHHEGTNFDAYYLHVDY